MKAAFGVQPLAQPLEHGESHKGEPEPKESRQEKGMGAYQSDKLAHPRLPAVSPPGGCSHPSAVGSKAMGPSACLLYTCM